MRPIKQSIKEFFSTGAAYRCGFYEGSSAFLPECTDRMFTPKAFAYWSGYRAGVKAYMAKLPSFARDLVQFHPRTGL